MTLDTLCAALFVPGSRPDRFAKAAAAEPDAVILDLEDAVPSDLKDAARAALTRDSLGVPVVVRINARGTPWHDDDLRAVAALQPIAVMLPKAEEPSSVVAVVSALAEIPVIALIETARGMAEARALAALPGVARLGFGSIDYCDDVGMEHEREVLVPARTELVLASRLANLAAPLDGVTTRFDDPSITRADAAHAKTLGMTGKLCIHPVQVDIVRAAFAPDPDQVAWAQRVLATDDGAASVDGEMVDEPVRARARRIVATSIRT